MRITMKGDLSQQFAKFAGREVQAIEHYHNMQIGDKTITATEVRLDDNDPAVAELTAAAIAAGYELRLWLPRGIGTMDVRPNRLNAHIEKAADGAYRISSRFTLG